MRRNLAPDDDSSRFLDRNIRIAEIGINDKISYPKADRPRRNCCLLLSSSL